MMEKDFLEERVYAMSEKIASLRTQMDALERRADKIENMMKESIDELKEAQQKMFEKIEAQQKKMSDQVDKIVKFHTAASLIWKILGGIGAALVAVSQFGGWLYDHLKFLFKS